MDQLGISGDLAQLRDACMLDHFSEFINDKSLINGDDDLCDMATFNVATFDINGDTIEASGIESLNVNNIVTAFELGCEFNVKEIQRNCPSVDFTAMTPGRFIVMKFQRPFGAVRVHHNGRCVGYAARDEETAFMFAYETYQRLRKMGFPVTGVRDFRIINVFATYRVPFKLDLKILQDKLKLEMGRGMFEQLSQSIFESEVANTLDICLRKPRVTVKIYFTGCMAIFGKEVKVLTEGIRALLPLLQSVAIKGVSVETFTK
ncbi:hypothetical protein ACOME3_003573 [Neoechinorhynchus agilis]